MKNKYKYLYIPFLIVIMIVGGIFCFATNEQVKNCNINVTTDSDGDVTVSQEWVVDFSLCSDSYFGITVPVIDDSRYAFSEFCDITASIDEVSSALIGEALSGEQARIVDNTYTLNLDDNGLDCVWYIENDSAVHTFRITYTMSECIKIIDSNAVFYCGYLSADDAGKSENTVINITYPDNCTDKDVEILTENKYISKKNGNSISFSGGKINETVEIGIGFPTELFPTVKSYSTKQSGLNTTEIILIVIASVIAFIMLAVFVFSGAAARKFFIDRCKKTPYSESSYKSHEAVFSEFTSAQILKTVNNGNMHKADYFIGTVMSLAVKGCLKCEDGKIVKIKNGKHLKNYERDVVLFFSKDEMTPIDFYKFINKFNRKIHCVNIYKCISPKYYSLVKRCFEIYLSAENYDNINVEKISLSVFRNKASLLETVVAVIRNKPNGKCVTNGLFAFRTVYDKGEEEYYSEKGKRNE